MTSDEIKAYLAKIGAKGGKATGKSKVRGGAGYYRRIALKSGKTRRAKAAQRRATK